MKLIAENETLLKDISKLNKKIETHKDDTEAQDMKIKWAQNKLKIETDAHKVCTYCLTKQPVFC